MSGVTYRGNGGLFSHLKVKATRVCIKMSAGMIGLFHLDLKMFVFLLSGNELCSKAKLNHQEIVLVSH